MDLVIYESSIGTKPFEIWLKSLKSSRAKAKIADRIDRIERGLLGDIKSIGGGVHEIRINFEKGYRLYFANDGQKIIVLLCGSHKDDQKQEVKRAKDYHKDYLRQKTQNQTAGNQI